uniref:C-type lectin domain-containing protein n=1 Tax=Anas platyrhynchos platyrhynchos TaxID=8840 RepID=A0A493T6Z4_ANAPP
MKPDTSLTAMELEVRKNTHPEQEEVLNPPRESSPRGMGRKCHCGQKLLALLCVVLSLLVLALLVALIVVQQQSHSSHPQFSHMCPTPWIGFQSKCYYFSEDESNWNTSLEKCKAMEASLTSIDSLEDMAFIRRCKGQGNHWVGLHEEGNGQWRWTNGTAFNNWSVPLHVGVGCFGLAIRAGVLIGSGMASFGMGTFSCYRTAGSSWEAWCGPRTPSSEPLLNLEHCPL